MSEPTHTFKTRTLGTRPVFGRRLGTTSPKYRVLRSRWMILINTNIDYEKIGDEGLFNRTMDCLENAANDLVNQRNELVRAGILVCYDFDPNDRRSLVTPSIPTPPNPYLHGSISQAFEDAPATGYLHQHIDLTLDHVYGEGAIALQLDRENLYFYIAQRLRLETGQDFARPGHKLFIRIRRIPANMAKSYLGKSEQLSEARQGEFNRQVFGSVPYLSANVREQLLTSTNQ